MVAHFHFLFAGLILGGELLRILHRLVDFILAQVGGSGDGDLLLVAGAQILGGYMDDAVGVDVEADLDLGHAPRRRRDARQLEPAQGLIVLGQLTLALEHMDLYAGLPVGGGGEDLALLGGDGGIPVDQPGEHAAHGLNAQGQRRYIQQQYVLHLAAQHAALDGSANGHALVRVDALEGLLAGDLLHQLLHGGHTGGAAHQDHLVDLIVGQARILHGDVHAIPGLIDQVGDQLVELGPADGDIQMLGAGSVRGDKGQVYIGLGHGRKLDLRLFRRFLQPLQGHPVLGKVDAAVLLEFRYDVVHQPLVEVVAAQPVVAVGGQHFEYAVADLQDGYIEGTAAQVVNQDLLVVFLIHAVGKGCRRRLVDDPQHLQARDPTRILGGLPLAVAKVSGHRNDRLGHSLAQIGFRVMLELLQDHGADLLGRIILAVDVLLIASAHLPFDGADGLIRVGDGLALCHLAHHTFIILKRHHRRGGTRAFRIGDDDGFAAFQYGYARVRGSQINTDDLRHDLYPPKTFQSICIIARPSPYYGE